MKRIAVFLLLVALVPAWASPRKENKSIGENGREARAAARQHQKYVKKASRKQRKAIKKAQKQQRKMARQGRRRTR